MTGKTKEKKDGEKCAEIDLEKNSDEESDTDRKGNWSEDQQAKSYYYDDAHGYEIYNPDDDEK